jgi:ELWxxDGT repeat protein
LLQASVTYDQGISALTNFNGKLYFFANGSAGDGLYVSDGTVAGTTPVKIIRTNANVLPQRTFILNNRIYFFWSQLGQPTRLWSSDGTAAGTNPIWDLPQGYVQSISPVIDGHVFFGANGQLWRSDGTPEGTVSMWTGSETYNYPGAFAVTDGNLFFVELGYTRRPLYVANRDGTGVTHVNIPSDDGFETGVLDNTLVALGHRVLFNSRTNSSHMDRLFSTDGTGAEPVQFAGGPEGLYYTELSYPVLAGDRAVFLQTSATGSGLWSTDGTVAGTKQILSTRADILSAGLFSAGGKAFYMAQAGAVGLRLIESDGTAAGTRPIHYLATGTSLTYWLIRHVATYQDRIVLRGSSSDGIFQLWSLDPNVPTGSITGNAYYDLNRNGTRERFERYFSGNIYIDLDGNDTMDSTIDATEQIDLNNPYLFDGLPPDSYAIRVAGNQTMTNPASDEYQIDLQPGQNITAADFALSDEGGVGSQTVWVDLNGDGAPHYINEPVMETAADGTYGFVIPAGGTYLVRRDYKYQWRQTNPSGLDGVNVAVTNGEVAKAANIGIVSDATPPRAESGSFDLNQNQLRVDFSENIANLISGALKINNRTTGAEAPSPTLLSFDLATHTALFRLSQSGLPDGDYQAALSSGYGLVDLASNHLVDGFTFVFFILKGDLNRDRSVNIADFITLSSNFGKTNANYADGDLNYDGEVSIADFIDLASKFNTSLPPPAPASASQAPAAESVSPTSVTTELLQQNERETKKHRSISPDWRKPHRLHHRRHRSFHRR